MWLKDQNFINEVKEYWVKIPAVHLLPKLFDVSTFMAKWGRKFFNKFREKVRRQKEVIAELRECTDSEGVNKYIEEVEKLNELLFQEETYWKQRAKIFWLEEGDANTKNFHASATSRRKANQIAWLETTTGDKTDDQDEMCRIVKEYYENIFKASDQTVIEESESGLVITEVQNILLTQELTFEEFTVAVNQMHPDKASGPDGLNPAFFQKFWGCMGREVYGCCKEWLNECAFLLSLTTPIWYLFRRKVMLAT